MFTETFNNPENKSGWVEVIVGAMFSGKTEELIRRLERARIANQKVEVFKPMVDSRYSAKDIVSHSKNSLAATTIGMTNDILKIVDNVDVVGIDEAQFFDKDIVSVCNTLANMGVRVIVAGLDMDYLGKPFGRMPELLAIAEDITKVHPVCIRCGNLAQYTHRLIADKKRVLLGEKETYEPLCRKCFNKAMNLT